MIKYILSTLSVIFTFCILSLLGHNILFKKSLNVILNDLESSSLQMHFIYLFILTVISMLTTLYLIIMNRLCLNNSTKPKSHIFTFFHIIITKIISIFIHTYDVVFNLLSANVTKYVVKLAKLFLIYNNKSYQIIFTVEILPRIFISSCFLIELYYEHLHYYFVSLSLLIIPFLFRGLVFILRDIGPRLKPEFSQMVIQTIVETNRFLLENEKPCQIISLRLKPEYFKINENMFFNDYYDPIFFIEPEMLFKFIPLYTRIKLYVHFCYYLFFSCGWVYIIYNYI